MLIVYLSVKELKSATIQRLASFESTHGVEQSSPKQKNPKFCRSTSENMHEYRPSSKRLTTVAIDNTHLGLDMFNIHGKDGDTHLRRRIVSASENQSTTEDIYRRSVSATSPYSSKNNVRQNDTEIKNNSKANITEEEEVETGSVRHYFALSINAYSSLQKSFTISISIPCNSKSPICASFSAKSIQKKIRPCQTQIYKETGNSQSFKNKN